MANLILINSKSILCNLYFYFQAFNIYIDDFLETELVLLTASLNDSKTLLPKLLTAHSPAYL